ncbi:MAG: hypothetical protein ACOYWZ_05830 [Bacillota bacterium]
MASNEEIMEKLNTILEEIEKLWEIKAECININSGTFTIEAGSKSPIEIKEARDITIKAGQDTTSLTVEVSKGNVESISISSEKLSTVTIEAGGDITGDIIAKEVN